MATTRVPPAASALRRFCIVALWILGASRMGTAQDVEVTPRESNAGRSYADMAGRQGAEGSGGGGGGEGGGESGGRDSSGPSAANSGAKDLPAPFGPFFEAINVAQLHRRLDEALGLDAGTQSPKPEAPEIPLALFIEVVRPLGGLKYENQTNYFIGSFTGHAPTLQTLSYEYVFADWNSIRLELTYPNGNLASLIPGYQHTLGVGPRGNWVHGVQLLPEIFLQRDFVGGRAFYIFGWKPEKDSPWSAALSLGADRASIEGTEARAGLTARQRSGPGAAESEGFGSVWRPLISANAFYAFGPSLAVGLENDLFPSSRLGEYLILPNLTWRPTQHFFVQVGAGYYQLGSEGQATFMCRANIINPSPRKPRPNEAGEAGGGPSRRCLPRWCGGR
jgi:hypothetical protein